MLRLHWLNLVAAYFDWTTPAVHLWGGTCEYTVLSCTWAALYVEHQEFRCNYFHLNKLINKCIVNSIEAALHCYFIHLQYTFTWHIYICMDKHVYLVYFTMAETTQLTQVYQAHFITKHDNSCNTLHRVFITSLWDNGFVQRLRLLKE